MLFKGTMVESAAQRFLSCASETSARVRASTISRICRVSGNWSRSGGSVGEVEGVKLGALRRHQVMLQDRLQLVERLCQPGLGSTAAPAYSSQRPRRSSADVFRKTVAQGLKVLSLARFPVVAVLLKRCRDVTGDRFAEVMHHAKFHQLEQIDSMQFVLETKAP